MNFGNFFIAIILAFNLSLCMTYTVTNIDEIEYSNIFSEEWETFKIEHGKNYENEMEETFRQKIYMENRHRIAQHNKGGSSFRMEMNKFGDMLFHEFSAKYNTFKIDSEITQQISNQAATFISPAHVNILQNDTLDWRALGAVTPVKDQAQCGSCWSFGATGALEGQHFRKTGQLVSLSEQNLVDCIKDDKYGCSGCQGGNYFGAFLFIRDNGGIDTEESYPYSGQEGECAYSRNNNGATDVGFVQLTRGSESTLMNAVATQGPIAVAIDVEESFQMYRGGVYYEPECRSDPDHLDHAVLVVGYGTENGQDYWLVKNSWGKSWGEEGYIKMARNRDNNCGIATYAGYPMV